MLGLRAALQVAPGHPGQSQGHDEDGQAPPGADGDVVVAEEGEAAEQLGGHDQPGGAAHQLAQRLHALGLPAEVGQRQAAGAEQRIEQRGHEDEIAELPQRAAQRLQGAIGFRGLHQSAQACGGHAPGQGVQQAPAQCDQAQAEVVLREIAHSLRNGVQLPRRTPAQAQQQRHDHGNGTVVPWGVEHAGAEGAQRSPWRGTGSRWIVFQRGAPLAQPGAVHGPVAGEPQQLLVHDLQQLAAAAQRRLQHFVGLLQDGEAAQQHRLQLVDQHHLPVLQRDALGRCAGSHCAAVEPGSPLAGVEQGQAQLGQAALQILAPDLDGGVRGQCHPLLPQPLAHGGAGAAQAQAGLGVAQCGGELVAAVLVARQGVALLGQAVGVIQYLGREHGVLLGQFAQGRVGRTGLGELGGRIRRFPGLLLQPLAAAFGDELVQPGHARCALQQLAALGLQLRIQQALAGFDGGLLFLAQGQLQHGPPVLGAAPHLAGLREGLRLAGLRRHGLGALLHALAQRGQVDLAGLGDQVDLVRRRFLHAGLERCNGLALLGQQALEHLLAGIGGNALLPALELAGQFLVVLHRGLRRSPGPHLGAQAVQFLREGVGLLAGRVGGIPLGLDGGLALLVRAGAVAAHACLQRAQGAGLRQGRTGSQRQQHQHAGHPQHPRGREPPAARAGHRNSWATGELGLAGVGIGRVHGSDVWVVRPGRIHGVASLDIRNDSEWRLMDRIFLPISVKVIQPAAALAARP